MAVSKNKKEGKATIKQCFTLGCDKPLKAVMVHRYAEPKYVGIVFECEKCGKFDRSGNKVTF